MPSTWFRPLTPKENQRLWSQTMMHLVGERKISNDRSKLPLVHLIALSPTDNVAGWPARQPHVPGRGCTAKPRRQMTEVVWNPKWCAAGRAEHQARRSNCSEFHANTNVHLRKRHRRPKVNKRPTVCEVRLVNGSKKSKRAFWITRFRTRESSMSPFFGFLR